jgi:hypothetical protein
MQGIVDAGVTWQSEAVFQEQVGNPIERVEIQTLTTAPEYMPSKGETCSTSSGRRGLA